MEQVTVTPARIFLVRHGQTDWNNEHRLQGHLAVHLNAQGLQDAEHVARTLQRDYLPLDALYSSDLERAVETALVISRVLGMDVVYDKRLREWDQGDWSGMLAKEARALAPEWSAAFNRNPLKAGTPNGETGEELVARAVSTLDEIAAAHPGGRVAVVSHGATMSMVRWYALAGLDLGYLQTEQWQRWPVNGEVVALTWGS